MSVFSRPCRACGRRAEPGQAYCPACRSEGALRPSSCRVCGLRTAGGPYCPEHSLEAERLATQPWRRAYSDPAYQHNRKARYHLAGGRCEACGVTLTADWECDHLTPLRDGGTHAVENLRAHCRECHRKKTAADRRRRSQTGGP